jgi:ADP-ribose pyrophosphatase
MTQVDGWQLVTEEVVAEYDIFEVVRRRARSPRTDEVHSFHVLDLPDSALVVPLTTDGRVVLVEQYRHGVQRVCVEFPAGVLEPGEDPVRAALRELEEETGYRAGSATLVAEFDADPALQRSAVRVVLARDCTADGERRQDDGEAVAVRLATVAEVAELIRTGGIRNATALAAWSLSGLGGAAAAR